MIKKYYSLVTAERTADVTIYGDITSWPWQESDVSSYNLAQELSGLDVDAINVHINSYGGEVGEALAIFNTLLKHKATVTTYVDGFACSAATIIFMAGDRRVVEAYSNFLVHPAWSYVQGNADELRKEADDLDRITEQSIKAYMGRITKSREELEALMKEERFMTPEEVLEWGFATEIEDAMDDEIPEQSVKQLVYDRLRSNSHSNIADRLEKAVTTLEGMTAPKAEETAPAEEEIPHEEEAPVEESAEEPETEPEIIPDAAEDIVPTEMTALERYKNAMKSMAEGE